MPNDYERGWQAARDVCLAIAEKRLDRRSVLKGAFPAIDDVLGTDMATEHEWFCKGRESAAKNIVSDIKALKPDAR